jgi:hypothetical protein
MSVQLTTDQLRKIMQLPERPFEDRYAFDGTTYYDLSQREPCTMFSVSGTASGMGRLFQIGTDFQLTAGCIDWSLPGATKPDVNTLFIVDYTYSRLGGDAASTAAANASYIVAQDLGPSFPYGASTTSGSPFNSIALYGTALIAARQACLTLSTSDIVLVDDSKKTSDWIDMAKIWGDEYKKYLTMIRPGGMVRSFNVVNRNIYQLLFGEAEARAFDGPAIQANNVIAGYPDSGVF